MDSAFILLFLLFKTDNIKIISPIVCRFLSLFSYILVLNQIQRLQNHLFPEAK